MRQHGLALGLVETGRERDFEHDLGSKEAKRSGGRDISRA
jgi:hypothetical protein